MSVDEINVSDLNLSSSPSGGGGQQTRVHKTTIIIVVGLFVMAALGGGSFYYRGIYQPRVYVQTIVPLYENAGLLGSETGADAVTRGPSDPLDYIGAAEAIAARAQTLNAARAEIAKVEPPMRKLAFFHAELLEVFDLAVRANEEAEERAQFLAKLLALKEELGALREVVSEPQQNIHTIGDLKEAWLPHLRAARTTGTEAFTDTIRTGGKDDAALVALSTSWDEVGPAIDFLVETLDAFRSTTRVEEFGTLLTPEQNTRGEKGFRHIEQLIELIDDLTTSRSAQSLLDSNTVSGEEQVALSEKAFATYRELEELKRHYLHQ